MPSVAFLAVVAALPVDAHAAVSDDLESLSLEDLGKIQITAVSKSPEDWESVPASVFVITHEDIIRSGVRSVVEALRLAPNLQVAQINASTFAVTARGFNSAAASKLLVLIDGRTVYTPFVNGVFWQMQDIPLDTVDRIEVISGPAEVTWGANAGS